jgi:O-antigen ligase/polysaccharide polymerase Wzy-like membrane protein
MTVTPRETQTSMLTGQAERTAYGTDWPDGGAETAPHVGGLLPLLIAMLVFLYIFCGIGLQGVPGVARSALVCAAGLWCLLFEGIRRGRILVERWFWLPVVFFVYCALMALRAQDMTVELIGKLVTVWGGALGVGVALRNGVRWTVPVHAMICAALASMVAHWLGISTSVMWSQDLSLVSQERASGLMGNPNVLAMACGFPAYFVFLLRDRFNLAVRLLCLGLAIYGVILTGSRKGVLLVLCLFICIGFHQTLTHGRILYVVLCVLAMALLVLLLPADALDGLPDGADSVLAIQRTMLALNGEGRSFLERAEMIRISEQLFWQRPVFGYGLGMFRHVSGLGQYTHNNYCELAIGGGILAIVMFYAIHWSVFQGARFVPRRERVCVWILLANVLLQDAAVVSYLDRLIVLVVVMSLVFVYRPVDVRQGDWSSAFDHADIPYAATLDGAR